MKGVLELNDEDFQKITSQKLDGPAFLDLTQDDLMKIGMTLGSAKTITRLVKKLKGEEQVSMESQLMKRMFEEFKETQFELLKQILNRIKELKGEEQVKRKNCVLLFPFKSKPNQSRECMWYNPVSNKQFMSVDIYALPFSIKGTADVVVTKKAFVKTWNVVGGI
ncbi:hypothetical protein C2G38_2051321 [Gigaspora rosea]|uniref:Uncharacterized protein n=1 Tax=Gigaspora rosea TaxID=44941 RepID=A0A397TWW6_9GLOM|nr:hypothetical protein C2G38_2051321 [Gigaspora rosea]